MTTVNSGDTVILTSNLVNGQTTYVFLGPKKPDGAYVAYVATLIQGYPVTPLTVTGNTSGPIQPNTPFYLTTTAADGLVRYFAPVPGGTPEFTTTPSPITITNLGQVVYSSISYNFTGTYLGTTPIPFPRPFGFLTISAYCQSQPNFQIPACVNPPTPAPTVVPPTIPPTVSPTTISPTTISPTTISPTTISPTTISPTTISPTTTSPTTTSPTTISPRPKPWWTNVYIWVIIGVIIFILLILIIVAIVAASRSRSRR